MKFHEFIKIKRKQKKITMDDLCKALKTSKTTIQRLEDGQIKEPSPLWVKTLSKLLEVEYYYLMELCGYLEDAAPKDPSPTPSAATIEILPWALLPSLHSLTPDDALHLSKETLPQLPVNTSFFALKIHHNRWVPFLLLGDYVIIQNTQKAKDGDILLVLVGKDHPQQEKSLPPANFVKATAVGKQLVLSRVGMSEPEFSMVFESHMEKRIVGRVVEVRRQI